MARVLRTVRERTMMRKSEYFERIQEVSNKVRCVLLSLVLCVGLLTGCGEHDRALVLELQEDVAESEMAQDTSGLMQNEQTQNESKQLTHGTTGEVGGVVQEVDAALLYVHVCGAVVSPGVVVLPVGSRVEDALVQAGGFREDAGTDYVNLAAKVEDGQQLYFPTKEEAEEMEKNTKFLLQESQAQRSGKVNINTAGIELLCTLPGIGEARARDIIEYRESHGGFQTIEDIMQVPGIKQNVFEKLCDSITVN